MKRSTKKISLEDYSPLKTSFSIQNEIQKRCEKEAWAMSTDPVVSFVAFPNEDPDLNENENDLRNVVKMIYKDVMNKKAPVFEEPQKGDWAEQNKITYDDLDEDEKELLDELKIKLEDI